jgi:hypothetical protein
VIASPVIVLVMPDRSNDGQFVADVSQPCHVFGEQHAGHLGGYRPKFPTDLDRRIWLWIEGLKMAWAAIQPNQNASRVFTLA